MAKLMQQLTSMFKDLLAPAEDPRVAYSDPWQRQQELLTRVNESLAQNTNLRKGIEKRIAMLKTKIPQLQETAKQALTNGREDMARMALQQRHIALLEIKSLETNAQEVWMEEQRISIVAQRLTAQMDAIRVRQEMTAARYTAAESQVMAHEVLSDFSKEIADMGQTLERTEQKAERLQAQANAFEAMSDYSNLNLDNENDPISRQLLQIDIDSTVEEQLLSLKQTINGKG